MKNCLPADKNLTKIICRPIKILNSMKNCLPANKNLNKNCFPVKKILIKIVCRAIKISIKNVCRPTKTSMKNSLPAHNNLRHCDGHFEEKIKLSKNT